MFYLKFAHLSTFHINIKVDKIFVNITLVKYFYVRKN